MFQANPTNFFRRPAFSPAQSSLAHARRFAPLLLTFVILFSSPAARADLVVPDARSRIETTPDELKNVSVKEHFNAQLPLDLAFLDDQNHVVHLKDYFKGDRPVLLQLGYYKCPMLCDYISRGATQSLKNLTSLTAGKDFDVVFVSIDPSEDPPLAQQKKKSYLVDYDRPGSEAGWHFLTGAQPQINQLAQAIGYEYKWVASARQYSHPAVIMICTPQGKVSRYLYGVQFPEETLRLSLVEASQNKIGTTTDHFLLTCFVFDGKQGKYALSALKMMRLGGILTVVILGLTLIHLFRREGRRNAQPEQPQ